MSKTTKEMNLVDIDKLVPYVNNARTHSPEQINKIRSSLREFGFVNPVIIDKDYNIIAGHGRVEAAKLEGIKEIPCVLVDYLTPAQKKAYIIADNRMGLDAGWNEEILKLELQALSEEDYDLTLTGFEQVELDNLLEDKTPAEVVEDDFDVDSALNEPSNIKSGDIILLGRHRLMCGDSTKQEDVDVLMDGKKADLLFTDPPYNVSMEQKSKDILKTTNYSHIENDNLPLDQFQEFLLKVFTNANDSLKNDASYYVFSCQGGDSEMMMMMMMMREAGIKCRHQIIWVKDAPVFSMGRLDYDYKHEPILYGWKDKHNFYRKGEQDKSVWEFKRTANKLHPTMKPVELIANALNNSTIPEDIVLDLFGGSGSTLIACEQTNRTCCMMELDNHYAQVIVDRYINLVGTDKDVYCIRDGEKIPYKELLK